MKQNNDLVRNLNWNGASGLKHFGQYLCAQPVSEKDTRNGCFIFVTSSLSYSSLCFNVQQRYTQGNNFLSHSLI